MSSEHFPQVQERFAHSHHHNVRRSSSEHILHRENLIHDLVRRKIASETLTSRRAEGAPHGTANLGAYTHREPSPSSWGLVLLFEQFITILVQVIIWVVRGANLCTLDRNTYSLDDAATP